MYVDRWGWPAFVFVPFVVHAKPAPTHSSRHARRRRQCTSAGGVPRVIEVGSAPHHPPSRRGRQEDAHHRSMASARPLVCLCLCSPHARVRDPPCDACRRLTSPSLRAKPRREHYHHCVLAVQGRVQGHVPSRLNCSLSAPRSSSSLRTLIPELLPPARGITHPPLIWIVNALLR
ncbi:hypothetical protein B0H13DRAFT_2063416 [Mycena leptocephala]|nr:hypothetical protein B0H13DRAFT_2063416 [Mycena leptocephala]